MKTALIAIIGGLLLLVLLPCPQGNGTSFQKEVGICGCEEEYADSDYTYKLTYLGFIKNVEVTDDIVSFDAVHLWRFSRIRNTDGSYWDISLSYYENIHHDLQGYTFRGILRDRFICGQFSK